MMLEELRLQNFRSFGPGGTRLRFSAGLTALIGANGSGKTAAQLALCRMFGTNWRHRNIVYQDFHINPDEGEKHHSLDFELDAIFSLPELCESEVDNSLYTVPEFFQQMSIEVPGEAPRIRLCLRAKWEDNGTYDGVVEEDFRWIMTLDEQYIWDEGVKVRPEERSRIQFIYIPVDRSADVAVANLLKGRLWKSAIWSDDFRSSCEDAIEEIQNMFKEEPATKLVVDNLNKRWKNVNTAETDTNAIMRIIDSSVENIVKKAEFSFSQNNNETERTLNDLSDGQRSLFYITLTSAVLELEQNLIRFPDKSNPFELEEIERFYHTILSIEEPENSISPFLLSRAIRQAKNIASLDNAQVVVSSHSPAILGRVEVDDVRYFRFIESSKHVNIFEIDLPEDDEESLKFVRLAVKAYPELYFARFVILCEGETEQIVIHRIAEAMGVALDPNFVPVVPLAGRFAQHFWRLLSMLEIPHATILDYDLGRRLGGMKVVKRIVRQLVDQSVLTNDSHRVNEINNSEDDTILEESEIGQWLFEWLDQHNVYVSYPMDIDMCMLESFEEHYKATMGGELRIPQDKLAVYVRNAKIATLGSRGKAELYEEGWDESFLWYRKLFTARSKPQSHILALSKITDEELRSDCPDVLKKLITKVSNYLNFEDNQV